MLNLFMRLFSGSGRQAQELRPAESERLFEGFLKEEIALSSYVKPEFRDIVFTAIMDGSKLKAGPYLTTEEKRAMGLNARFKISHAQVSALTYEGLAHGPEKVFTALRMNATHRSGRLDTIRRMSDTGFSFFSLMSPKDERECDWCRANDGKKFPIDTDINQLIRDNCTCEYCRCTVRAQRR